MHIKILWLGGQVRAHNAAAFDCDDPSEAPEPLLMASDAQLERLIVVESASGQWVFSRIEDSFVRVLRVGGD